MTDDPVTFTDRRNVDLCIQVTPAASARGSVCPWACLAAPGLGPYGLDLLIFHRQGRGVGNHGRIQPAQPRSSQSHQRCAIEPAQRVPGGGRDHPRGRGHGAPGLLRRAHQRQPQTGHQQRAAGPQHLSQRQPNWRDSRLDGRQRLLRAHRYHHHPANCGCDARAQRPQHDSHRQRRGPQR